MTLTNDEQIEILNSKIESISIVIDALRDGIISMPEEFEGKELRQDVLDRHISEVHTYNQMIIEIRG